jgi:hypothetical protein
MFDWIFYVAFLFIIAALILFFLRQRGSYFKPVQMLFILAFGFFAIVIFCNFIKNHVIQEAWGLFREELLGLPLCRWAAA